MPSPPAIRMCRKRPRPSSRLCLLGRKGGSHTVKYDNLPFLRIRLPQPDRPLGRPDRYAPLLMVWCPCITRQLLPDAQQGIVSQPGLLDRPPCQLLKCPWLLLGLLPLCRYRTHVQPPRLAPAFTLLGSPYAPFAIQ